MIFYKVAIVFSYLIFSTLKIFTLTHFFLKFFIIWIIYNHYIMNISRKSISLWTLSKISIYLQKKFIFVEKKRLCKYLRKFYSKFFFDALQLLQFKSTPPPHPVGGNFCGVAFHPREYHVYSCVISFFPYLRILNFNIQMFLQLIFDWFCF